MRLQESRIRRSSLEIGSDTKVVHYNADFSSADVHFNQFQFPMTVGKT
jgi:hypothetical protein